MYKPKTSWRSGCKTDVLLYIKVSELFINYSLAKFRHISGSHTVVPGPAASKWPWNLLETLTRMPNPNHVNQKLCWWDPAIFVSTRARGGFDAHKVWQSSLSVTNNWLKASLAYRSDKLNTNIIRRAQKNPVMWFFL